MSVETLGALAQCPGRTTIQSRAIRRVVEAVAAEAAGVPAVAVRAELSDHRGRLAVSVTTPLEVGPRAGARGTLVERATVLAQTVTSRLATLTGRSVGRVQIRFSGLERAQERRVQ